MILDFFDKGGFVMWLLAVVGFVAVTLIIRKGIQLITFSLRYHKDREAMNQVFQLLKDNRNAEAKRLLTHSGPQETLLSQAIDLQDESLSLVGYQSQLESIYDHEVHHLEKGLSTILILGEILPMLGLLGTVSGMIQVFTVIGVHGTGDAGLLAGGISEALLTTQVGLLLGIPVMFLHNQLNNMVDRLSQLLRRAGARAVAIYQQKA